MKTKPIILFCILAAALTCPAMALDYSFSTDIGYDFYGSTSYEEMYGSAYIYGGVNVSEFQGQPVGNVGGAWSQEQPENGFALNTGGSGLPSTPGDTSEFPQFPQWELLPGASTTKFTDVSEVKRSDGSIGTLSIPSLGIKYKTYDGATASNMNKGAAHFASTSAWDGNIGLCGHNRGSSYNIGSIKNMSIGDTIKYSTNLGTRTYAVTFVGTISNDDWSYLNATSDNRITLITCLANRPEVRICVQAVEVK